MGRSKARRQTALVRTLLRTRTRARTVERREREAKTGATSMDASASRAVAFLIGHRDWRLHLCKSVHCDRIVCVYLGLAYVDGSMDLRCEDIDHLGTILRSFAS